MHYCSKECQKNDWPNHQKACKEMAHERDIVNAQFNGECVYQYFCRWIQRHWPTLIDALLAILDISTNPTAHEKRALQVMVSYKGGNAGSTDVASCMEVQMVSPFDLERAIRNEPARYEPLLAYRKRLGEDVKRVRPSTYDAGIIFIALVTPEGECITGGSMRSWRSCLVES
ncbi:unnamed protein product [Somion occarium]|uniref:MYND-type domain-containing protein n=1 Tax=Somion occarium TaxID=3059160 RepID=A0ABP1DX87_9APHY